MTDKTLQEMIKKTVKEAIKEVLEEHASKPLTTKEAGEYLNMEYQTFRKIATSDDAPKRYVSPTKRITYYKEDLDNWARTNAEN